MTLDICLSFLLTISDVLVLFCINLSKKTQFQIKFYSYKYTASFYFKNTEYILLFLDE